MRNVRIWPITITGKLVMVCPNTTAKEVAMNTVMVRLIEVNPRQRATCLLSPNLPKVKEVRVGVMRRAGCWRMVGRRAQGPRPWHTAVKLTSRFGRRQKAAHIAALFVASSPEVPNSKLLRSIDFPSSRVQKR